jgi:hypothetical protein
MPSLPPENRNEIDDLRRRVATLESQNKDLNCKLKIANLKKRTRNQKLGTELRQEKAYNQELREELAAKNESLEQLTDRIKCPICYSVKEIMFAFQCGHQVCGSCSEEMQNNNECHSCRTESELIRLY